ncbi:ABC transporter G family member 2 [Dendrobium catenatum]|uniref:ABC transporter G family member 2 n=1 Tax=Dendrobium catenatum TaxID=906689 RepID=A0A2I0V955_9ASPA|nr:ABC transporter G family member 2 [Dendrobium catenatum]
MAKQRKPNLPLLSTSDTELSQKDNRPSMRNISRKKNTCRKNQNPRRNGRKWDFQRRHWRFTWERKDCSFGSISWPTTSFQNRTEFALDLIHELETSSDGTGTKPLVEFYRSWQSLKLSPGRRNLLGICSVLLGTTRYLLGICSVLLGFCSVFAVFCRLSLGRSFRCESRQAA